MKPKTVEEVLKKLYVWENDGEYNPSQAKSDLKELVLGCLPKKRKATDVDSWHPKSMREYNQARDEMKQNLEKLFDE